MALTGGATAAVCILALLALAASAGAATPAPAPAPDCTSAFLSLADCLDYVTPGNNSARPSKICCGEVKTAVSSPSTVDCLCAAMAQKQSPIPVNMTRVLALPTACGQSPTVFNKCKVMPGGAPIEAPTPSSGGATASPPKPNAAARSPVSATMLVVVATVAAPLLAFYYL